VARRFVHLVSEGKRREVKVNVFAQKKLLVRSSATALVTVALVFAVAHAAFSQPNPNVTPNFTISSTISSSSTSQIPTFLYPGVQRYLWYTISNPQLVSITVDSVGISQVTAPSGCALSSLDFSQTSFSGSLVVPSMGSNSVSVPISLVDTDTNQDSCEGTSFNFTYSGSAIYTEVYGTAATVTGSPSPSNVGTSVVYTATVTASAGAGQDPVPSSPTGSVTFMDGPSAICTAVPLTSTGSATSTATCSPFAYSSTGTHSITAVYSNADGNFTGSSSSIFSQVVDP
jgi:hypothetical protein